MTGNMIMMFPKKNVLKEEGGAIWIDTGMTPKQLITLIGHSVVAAEEGKAAAFDLKGDGE